MLAVAWESMAINSVSDSAVAATPKGGSPAESSSSEDDCPSPDAAIDNADKFNENAVRYNCFSFYHWLYVLHRVKFRKEQFQEKLQMREAKQKQKQKDDKEKEGRLQALCNQVHTHMQNNCPDTPNST